MSTARLLRAALLALATVSWLPPTAAADFTCSYAVAGTVCSGVDDASDCFGDAAASRWGATVFVIGGVVVSVGGIKWCSKDGATTGEHRTSYVFVYAQRHELEMRSDETRLVSGDQTSRTCTTTVSADSAFIHQQRKFECLVQPMHPYDLVLP